MDIYADITIVKTINGRTYRLSIPWSAPYEELHAIIKDFENKAREMEESAHMIAQQKLDKQGSESPL